MASLSMIFVILAVIAAVAQGGLIGHQAFVAPYASSYNAHHINHAVAHPLLAPAPAVLAAPAPAPAVFAAPAPAPAVVAAPAPIPFAASGLLPAALPAPHFLPAPVPFAYSAGLPANYNLW